MKYTVHNKHIKILIIRLSSIGDILLTTPFVRQVRQAFPNAKIDYVIKSQYKDLLEANPNIDSLLVLNTDHGNSELKQMRKMLKKTHYTYIFDLHNNIRSNYLRYRLHADYCNHIKKDKVKQSVFVYLNKNIYDTTLPIPARYLQVGEAVGVRDDRLGLDFYWKESDENRVHQLLTDHNIPVDIPFFCIAPGASFFTKRWPLAYFNHLIAALQKEYSYPCVILGGSHDASLGAYLAQNSNTINLAGKTTLLESAVIISKSTLLISNDSGLVHMGSAVQTPLVVIFGSSVKELGFYPYRSTYRMLEVKDLECRPCSHIGKKYCPKKHFKCMRDILPESVFNAVKLILDDIN